MMEESGPVFSQSNRSFNYIPRSQNLLTLFNNRTLRNSLTGVNGSHGGRILKASLSEALNWLVISASGMIACSKKHSSKTFIAQVLVTRRKKGSTCFKDLYNPSNARYTEALVIREETSLSH